jgi:NAD(P)-dependent dehydrogenase (short-subunit alcohol dehydrogenase family)
MTSFSGKRMLITGAASGIGRATALLAADKGAKLFVTDRDEEGLGRLANELRSKDALLEARAFDVTDFDAVRGFAADVERAHDGVDILMNNAGIAIWGKVGEMPHDDWRRVIEVNLMGPIHFIECFVPGMIARRQGGHVVNVSSAAGLFGLPWHGAYSASKFGLRGLSEVLRFDLERYRIRVSLVCPGAVKTGLVETVKVAGVDKSSAPYQRLRRRFERHAATPERAARSIVRGVEKDRYFIYTSPDIAVGHWFQEKFALPYELVMRQLNRELEAVRKEQR